MCPYIGLINMKRCSPTNSKLTVQYISHSYLKKIILSKTSTAWA